MTVKIKICGIRHEEEALFCDQNKVDFLGFNFFSGSSRYISLEKAKDLIPKLNFPIPVGLFVNEKLDKVLEIISLTGIKIAQFHGQETPEFLSQIPIPAIKSFGIETEEDLREVSEYDEVADFFLFDKKSKKFGGTGESFSWEILLGQNFNKPFFLAGGVNIKNIPRIEKYFSPPNPQPPTPNPQLFAIDGASGSETDGKKDFTKISQIISLTKKLFL